MAKFVAMLIEKTSPGFIFWFFVSILSVFLFYGPFEQPILFDRAYLIYMSQVVFRGDSLYGVTTFGYTPLSVLLVAATMKVGALFSMSTIVSARISGLLLYGLISGSFFILLRKIFKDVSAPWIGTVLFVGFGFLQILSGVSAEPKLFVLTFTILGMSFFIERNWLMVGLCFSAGAMCWQVAIISIGACMIAMPWRSAEIKSIFLKFSVGIFLATVPVLVYLNITNGWMDFWDQAILRKLVVEGSSLGESPWKWLFQSIYPYFAPEIGHFIFGSIGFFLLVGLQFFPEKSSSVFRNQRIVQFIMAYVLIWSIFNTIEFQGPPDIIPMIGVIAILCTFLIMFMKQWVRGKLFWSVSVVVLIFYNVYDAFLYKIPFTYQDEARLVSEISLKYGDPFVIGFEEYYVVSEKAMPTKYMRFAPYEDYFLMKNGACQEVTDRLENIDYIVQRKRNSRTKSRRKSNNSASPIHQPNTAKINPSGGKCAIQIIESMTSSQELDSFQIQVNRTPHQQTFVTHAHYSVFKNDQSISMEK